MISFDLHRPAGATRTAGTARAACILAVAGALVLAGCSSKKSTTTSTSSTPAAPASSAAVGGDAASLVPAAVKSSGSLTIATDASYAPNEFKDTDGKTIIGMDVDLGNAIAAKLGLKASFQDVTFDQIIPGLAGGKYNLGMSSFTDTKDREGKVDFVTYFTAGTSVLVLKGNPAKITGPDDLCGHKVAIESGTTQELVDIPAKTKACTKAGKKAVVAVALPDQNAASLADQSGRADATLADSPVAEYQAKQPGAKFEVAGKSYSDAPYGIAIPKDAGTLKDAVLAAVKALIADGSYKTILDKWSIADGAITSPVIDGATS
ncbi:MAG: polar amino acid transport system substrate-binding protein [Pseudonocardiales bacterium]|nr:polar amino acid transport system substrate-binding protein [Pseudonocardiales bacterium]